MSQPAAVPVLDDQDLPEHADVPGLPFERALAELEDIVKQLEGGKVPLEDSIAIYERGEILKRHCESLLARAEARIERITLGPDGRPTGTVPLDPALSPPLIARVPGSARVPEPARERADLLLVSRGLFPTRARARAGIEAGLVVADGATVKRPSDRLRHDVELEAAAPHPWVSRGGVKLAAALEAFGLDVRGRECLDVGASTGGFTDVLLSRGARRVHAIDVGRGQLHPKLAADPRVIAREATDARDLRGVIPPGSIEFATVDVSFISLRLVLPAIVPLLGPAASTVALVKPQFEVGRGGLGKGGIVRDEATREAGIASVLDALPAMGLVRAGQVDAAIPGGDGNREVLIWARGA